MGLWGWLTGGSKAVEKGLDMVDKGIDMVWFTPEEKSIAGQKKLDWKLEWIKATGPQSKARRYIAYAIVGLWTYLVIMAVHLRLFGYKEQADFLFTVLRDVVNWPFIAVMSFYFAAHVVRANKK